MLEGDPVWSLIPGHGSRSLPVMLKASRSMHFLHAELLADGSNKSFVSDEKISTSTTLQYQCSLMPG